MLAPLLPKGTQLRVDAHFDNSAAKRGNPDPTADVFGGTQTWEEMMNPRWHPDRQECEPGHGDLDDGHTRRRLGARGLFATR